MEWLIVVFVGVGVAGVAYVIGIALVRDRTNKT